MVEYFLASEADKCHYDYITLCQYWNSSIWCCKFEIWQAFNILYLQPPVCVPGPNLIQINWSTVMYPTWHDVPEQRCLFFILCGSLKSCLVIFTVLTTSQLTLQKTSGGGGNGMFGAESLKWMYWAIRAGTVISHLMAYNSSNNCSTMPRRFFNNVVDNQWYTLLIYKYEQQDIGKTSTIDRDLRHEFC